MTGERGAVLRTEALSKRYVLGFFRRKVQAISDVTLSVAPGQIFGLLGPNGAGKTTTLKILMGLVRQSGGRAEVFGLPAGEVRAKRRVGYLPESPYFYDYLTGRELLMFMGQLFHIPRRTLRRRVAALLDEVGLARAADLALRRYSKGMLQRVGLAQALINDPELVVLDEPLTGLDPLGRKQLRELIAALRARGKTVVLSSHILSDVELLADEVAILIRGRTVATGPLHELLDARVISTEIVFRPPPGEAGAALLDAARAAGWAARRAGDLGHVVVEGDGDVDRVIDLVRERGGRVVSVTPRKESLEDVVVRQARAAPREAGEARP